jgi:ribose/xylose/arabinose/galactoside ABC-type transport system permease subunit
LEIAVPARSNISTRAIPEPQTNVNLLNAVAMLSLVALGAFFCVASYGLDLSPGFF